MTFGGSVLPSGERASKDNEFTLHDYFHVIRKKMGLILLVVVLGVLFTLFFSMKKKPVFRASGSLLIKASKQYYHLEAIKLLSFSMNTFAKMITSEELVSKAIARCGSFSSPADILKNLNVSQEPGAFMINISLISSDGRDAAAIVNSMMAELIDRTKEEYRSKIAETVTGLRDQLHLIEGNLRKTEKELRDYEVEKGIFEEKRRYDEVGRNIAELSKQLSNIQVEIEEARLTSAGIQRRLTEASGSPGSASRPEPFGNDLSEAVPPISDFGYSGSGDLRVKMAALLKVYRPNHPKIIELAEQIRNLESGAMAPNGESGPYKAYRDRLLDLKLRIASLEIREGAIRGLIAQENEKLREAPEKNLEYLQLLRKVEIARGVYSSVLQRHSEMEVVEASMTATAEIVQPAKIPESPELTHLRFTLTMAFLASLVMGIALAFLIEHLDTSFKNHDEVEQILGYSVIGLIPRISGPLFKTVVRKLKTIDEKIVTAHDPTNVASEAFNSLRVNLKFTMGDSEYKTIAITSPIRASGKTVVACNLAVSYSRAGIKTLLVDADLRKPMVHYMFSLDNDEGFTSYFLDGPGANPIMPTQLPNLDILTSGLLPENPLELLDSSRMDMVIDHLKARYDIVIFDCPPLLGIPDSAILGNKVDALLYLVSLRSSKVQQGRAGIKLIHQSGRGVNGIICNMVKDDELGGYYYRYG